MASMNVSYSRKGDVHSIETGGQALGTLIIDNTPVAPDARGGTAKQLLAASALYCYCGALAGALDARGVRYSAIRADAVLETGNNDLGQGRVKKIGIEARVTLSEEDADTFERVERIMRSGCLVTGSLHDGIRMEYDLQPVYEE
jgi:osmotically inducible protein OsmC